MADYDIVLRLFLALLFGGAIGLERRWRGHEAGPHTNALVAAGAALFIITGTEMGGDAAPRVLAQVATGIGFLAGGVILRDGLHVRGLNTAGTVWFVAALGCVIGLGRILLALEATILLIIANTIFHYVEHNVRRLEDEPDEGGMRLVRKGQKK
jgi:putative Mg2+ transporter-C (MgtC) family protein